MPVATTDSEAPSSHRVSGTSLRVTLSTRRYAKGEDRTADACGLATATHWLPYQTFCLIYVL
ncbi:MAG: hypothetical protein V7K83_31075 [Nostoc sp.]